MKSLISIFGFVILCCLVVTMEYVQAQNISTGNVFVKYKHAYYFANPFYDLVNEMPLVGNSKMKKRERYVLKESHLTEYQDRRSVNIEEAQGDFVLDQISYYDVSGLPFSVLNYSNQKPTGGYLKEFREDTIKVFQLNKDSVLVLKEFYCLNQEGFPIARIKNETLYTYRYDPSGFLNQIVKQQYGNILRTWDFENSYSGDTVIIKIFKDGTPISCYIYNAKGQRLETHFYNRRNESCFSKKLYFYNKKGEIVKEIEGESVNGAFRYESDVTHFSGLKLHYDISTPCCLRKTVVLYNSQNDPVVEMFFFVKKGEEVLKNAFFYEYEYY